MTQYIITIVPVVEDGTGTGTGPVAQTMVRIETEGDRLAVTEVTMRAPEGAGLVNGELPAVDFELLLRAFKVAPPARRPSVSTRTTAPATVRPTAGTAKDAVAGRTKKTRKGNAAHGSKTGHLKAGRAYRRAPDSEELAKVYGQTGTIAGVAAHFEVPVHTAQGWISRLRRNAALAGD